ncbi:MAG: hypothetical protein Q7R22_010455 [Verrucomicrobiota bacterium JB025]|nr:hypothetical protein [Verrucomicrobiota bacterium JB025]
MKPVSKWLAATFALAFCGGPVVASSLLFDSTVSRSVTLQMDPPEVEVSAIVTSSMDDIKPRAEWTSRPVSLVVADAEPPPMTGFEAVLSANGDRIDLDWSGSGALATGDIEYYEIFYDVAYFISTSGRVADVVLPLSEQTLTLEGLPPFQDRYLVIVAVDALGNRQVMVTPTGLYVLSPEVLSRPVSVFAEDLGNLADPLSRPSSLVVYDAAPPPPVLGVITRPDPRGTVVNLDWSAYERFAVGDIEAFEVYVSESLFEDVSGLSPVLTLNAETTGTTLTFPEMDLDRYFAVVALDAFGNREPLVTPSGAYVLFAEVMSRPVSFQAENLAGNADTGSRAADLLVYDDAPPAAIDGDLADATSTQTFRGVSLDWAAYDALAQLDIDHYDIYYSTSEFADIGDAVKIGVLPRIGLGGTAAEITLPDSLGLYYVAVVPVDGGGNYQSAVVPNLAQSAVGGINAPTGLSVAVDGQGLLFSWDTPPPGEQSFLANYRIFLPGGQEVELPAETTSWHSNSLPGALVYPFDLTAINIFDDPSDLVRAPAPAAAPKLARKCHVITTVVDAGCSYVDANGQQAEVMEDGEGGGWLVFDDEPVMPVTRTCPEQGTEELASLTSKRAYLLQAPTSVGKAYFSATSDDMTNWEQVSELVPGEDANVNFLMPFDDRDKAFFVIFAY